MRYDTDEWHEQFLPPHRPPVPTGHLRHEDCDGEGCIDCHGLGYLPACECGRLLAVCEEGRGCYGN